MGALLVHKLRETMTYKPYNSTGIAGCYVIMYT